MDFHFNGTVAPLLEKVAFIKADIEEIKTEYLKWRNEFNVSNLNFEVQEISENFFYAVNQLLPFRDHIKVLLMPTKSEWVGYTDNRLPAAAEKGGVIAKRLHRDVIEVCAIINSFGKTVNGWGGGWMSVINKEGNLIRRVELTWQEKWEFGQYGEPFDFENLDAYKNRFQRDRFTLATFNDYLQHFGIEFFNEDFYFPPDKKGFLIKDVPKISGKVQTTSLEEARKYYGFH